MLNFFIGLKKIFAGYRIQASVDSIAETVAHIISDDFIPRMKKMVQSESDEKKRAKLKKTLDEWMEEAKNKAQWKKMMHTSIPAGVIPSSKEELAGIVLERLWSKAQQDYMKRFNPADGIRDFRKLMKDQLVKLVKKAISKEIKHTKNRVGPTEEGAEAYDFMETTKGQPQPFAEKEFKYLVKDLGRHVLKKVDKKSAEVWKLWLKSAMEKGPENVKLMKDVVDPLVEKGVGGSSVLADRFKKQITPALVGYFKNVLKRPLNQKQINKMFKKGSQEEEVISLDKRLSRVAFVNWHRRVSEWMLEGTDIA